MENIKLEIIDINNQGNGVAKKDDFVYFVEDAKLGEIVEVKIIKSKKSYALAKKLKTIKESPHKEENPVLESELCGVYELYDINYDAQVQFKKNLIINSINKLSGENISNIEFLEADKRYEYRNKIELKISPKGELANFIRGTNDFNSIDRCIMVTPEINSVIQVFKKLIKKHNIKGYDSKTGEGELKNLIIRSTSLGETMAILIYNDNFNDTDFYIDLESENLLNSFYTSQNKKRGDYKIQKLNHIFGKTKITEQLGDKKFNISPKAFFQINKNMSYKIYMKARGYIKEILPDTIIDLYSGISTTSILLSDLAKKIISVEIVQEAVEDAKENAKLNNVKNIEWIAKPAEIAIEDINLDLKNSVALFDPPRKGLEKNIVEKIGNSKIDNIIYISCNPSTLARDIKLFKEYGFKIKELVGIDQFVNTLHCEAITLLSRSESDEDNSR